jgi:hypothetical protein
MDFPDGGAALDLDVAWIHGSEAAKYNTDPDIQVHACDEHTYILRQNKAVHYEAPFMFLLFGPCCSTPVPPLTRSSSRCAARWTRSSRTGWPLIRIRMTTGCWCCTPIHMATTGQPTGSSSAGRIPR